MKKVVEERKDIVFFIKMYPLPIHPEAYEKSKAIFCEKSLKLLEDSFENKPIPKPTCETSVIDENIKLGKRLNIPATPSLVLPDGRVIPGYKDVKALLNLIGN